MTGAKQRHKSLLVAMGFVLSLSFIATALSNTSASADAVTGNSKGPGISELSESWMRFRGIAMCYSKRDVNNSDYNSIKIGTWFKKRLAQDPETSIGYLNDNGVVSCGDEAFVTNSLKKIGFKSNLESYCSMWTAKRGDLDVKKNDDATINACISGDVKGDNNNFDMNGSNSDQVSAFKTAVAYKAPNAPQIPFEGNGTGKLRYWVGLQSLKKFCGGTRGAKYTDSMAGNIGPDNRKVVVNEVNLASGKIERYVYNLTKNDNDRFNVGVTNSLNLYDMKSCQDMAKQTWEYDDSFATFVKSYNTQYPDDVGSDIPGEDGSDGDEGESGVSATSCAIDGIGWIICPVMNFLAQVNEQAFGFLEGLLGVRPSLLQDEGTTEAWSKFRDIANVAFVIAFLAIIYSQITSIGISNYGIKKLLPKIAIAAIMVNLSYFVCLLLVDASNIAGSSLYSLITGIVQPLSGTSNGGLWTSLMTGVLYAGVGILLIVMIITAPIVLLAAGLVLLILVARQAFILILVIISPLAFVAYLLPNTENLFKKWWKALSAMLLVYPIIAVVFGASTLASNILMGIASDQGNNPITADSGDDNQLLAIVALAVMAIPLFAIPALLKGAMAGAGSIGAKLQGVADRTQGRASKAAGEGVKRRAENVESIMAARGGIIGAVGGYRARRNFRRKSMEGNTERRQEEALADHVLANPTRYDTRQQAGAVHTADKAWGENVKMHQGLYSHNSASDKQLFDDMENKKLSSEQRAAAAGMLMQRGRATQNDAVRKVVSLAQSGDDAIGGIQKQMADDMGSRKPMGLGSGAAAELRRGMLGVNGEGKPPGTGTDYNFDKEIAKRSVNKVAAADIPSLDPDDIDEILKGVTGQKGVNGAPDKPPTITGAELEKLRTNIKAAYSDERINQRIDINARKSLDAILNHNIVENTTQIHEEALVQNSLYDIQNNPKP